MPSQLGRAPKEAVREDALAIPALAALKGKRVILASNSPRRKQILASIGLEPEIVPSTFEENLPKSQFVGDAAFEYPVETSARKGMEVFERLMKESPEEPPDFVISADTVVVKNEETLEKPVDAMDNLRMLAELNAGKCEVITGVTIVYPIIQSPGFKLQSLSERTIVRFAESSHDILQAYVDSGEGIDRAGGFAIQGKASILIRAIEGDFNNVVGFPLFSFIAFLHELIESGEMELI